jgi:low affinity Fe/Cu permease
MTARVAGPNRHRWNRCRGKVRIPTTISGTVLISPGYFGMRYRFNRILTNAGSWLSRPEAVGLVGVYTARWLAFDRESFNWQAVASISTLLMTLFIQRWEHRDTQAIHAKLDELLRAQGDAKQSLTMLDDKEPEQIEAFRKRVRRSNNFRR